MKYSMRSRSTSPIWRPAKACAITIILMGLLQASVGYVGTSDSTIYFFGQNEYGQSGTTSGSMTADQDDRFLDVDVSTLRSTSCGGYTTVFLFENGTLAANGRVDHTLEFTSTDPEISSVSSNHEAVMYELTSNRSIYGFGNNGWGVLLNDSTPYVDNSQISPPRLNEDFRYCTPRTCLAFDHFLPGSVTDDPVIHEPNIPLYKFVGAWGDLTYGHLGMDNTTIPMSTSGMLYKGPDLIVKKASAGIYFSVFILHNNTVLVSGRHDPLNALFVIPPPTVGPAYLYRPILYNDSINASEVKIVDASTSPYHALLLSEDHRVFFFGSNYYFASGIPDASQLSVVNRVREVLFAGLLKPNDHIVQIAAQFFRSSVITKMGYVYIWGSMLIHGEDNTPITIQSTPKLINTFISDRYAVRYLNQDDITKTNHDSSGSCILSRPRAGNCTGEPPSADYYCIGGLWTTRGDGGNLETLTISSPIGVDGSLTISGPLTINQQSSIYVTECLSMGSIEIVKEQGVDTSSQELIATGKHCPDISGTSTSVITTGNVKKCEKTTASLSKSETSGKITYSAIFKTNNNDCKIWWIVLVSVLGGVVLVVIIVILLVTFVKPIRVKVRPFWLRNHR